MELKGDLTKQRRVEAVDKLLSVMTLLVASIFGLQAVGLDGPPPPLTTPPQPSLHHPTAHCRVFSRFGLTQAPVHLLGQ